MIVYCDAISEDEAEKRLRREKEQGISPVEGYERVAWIGIATGRVLSPVEIYDPQVPYLTLCFSDGWEARDIPKNADPRWARDVTSREVPMEYHARKIVHTVRRVQRMPEPFALLVHCFAGISRSTAVVQWVRERYGVTLPEGLPRGSWQPNGTLARLLRAADQDAESEKLKWR